MGVLGLAFDGFGEFKKLLQPQDGQINTEDITPTPHDSQ